MLWELLPTAEETCKKLIDSSEDGPEYGISTRVLRFVIDYSHALDTFRKNGWEGDFRGSSARVFFLPIDSEFSYGFVWKQDNNGSTFVVSPHELIWLKDYQIEPR